MTRAEHAEDVEADRLMPSSRQPEGEEEQHHRQRACCGTRRPRPCRRRAAAATGDTRQAAMTVPRTSEPTMAQRQMPSERRKPSRNRSKLSVIGTPRSAPLGPADATAAPPGGRCRAGRGVGRRSGARVGARAASGVSVPSTLPAVCVPGLRVVPSASLLQRVVDELAERGVALLDADAVRLLGELLADQLELAVGLGDVARAGSRCRWSPRRPGRCAARRRTCGSRRTAPAGRRWPGTS